MTKTEKIQSSIWYAGKKLEFVAEFSHSTDDGIAIDKAQSEIDYYKSTGKLACCTHYGNAHQLYVDLTN